MHRDNKPKGFFYLDHCTVDGKYGIIVDTFATAGNVNDSQPYIAHLDVTTKRFRFKPKAVGLDAGYFTAPVAESLARQIIGVFGYHRPTKGKNTLRKSAFEYDADTDSYTCPAGQPLLYSTTTREGYHIYKSPPPIARLAHYEHNAPKTKKRSVLLQDISTKKR